MVPINTGFWLEDTKAQRATQLHITSKKRNIDVQLPVLIYCWETASCSKMGIESYAAEVKEPLILYNEHSHIFFIIVIVIFFLSKMLSTHSNKWLKRGWLTLDSAHETRVKCSRVDGMPVDGMVDPNRISLALIYTTGWGGTLNEELEITRLLSQVTNPAHLNIWSPMNWSLHH